MRLFVLLAGYLLFAASSQAADINCVKRNFDKYFAAKEAFQKYPLNFIKDQPEAVQSAVKDQVAYQIAHINLDKSIAVALVDGNANLDMNSRLDGVFSGYLEQRCEERTPEKCVMYSLFLTEAMKKIANGNKDVNFALKHFNRINRMRMRESDKETQERNSNSDIVYKKIFKSMMQTEAAKIGLDIGSKKLSDLGC